MQINILNYIPSIPIHEREILYTKNHITFSNNISCNNKGENYIKNVT